MSELETIERLCALLEEACALIREQAALLAMHGIKTENGELERRRATMLNKNNGRVIFHGDD